MLVTHPSKRKDIQLDPLPGFQFWSWAPLEADQFPGQARSFIAKKHDIPAKSLEAAWFVHDQKLIRLYWHLDSKALVDPCSGHVLNDISEYLVHNNTLHRMEDDLCVFCNETREWING